MTSSATLPRQLRGGRPVWADSPRIKVRHQTRLEPITCDVAIVGAGISGAIAALMLAETGKDVVVLDRRPPVTGSTLASTAMIQFEIDTPLTELADRIGARKAERAYRRSFAGNISLRKLAERHGIHCAWKERDALLLAGNEMGSRGLNAEAAYRAKIGLPSNFLSQAELHERYGFDRTGAVLSTGNAELNPAQYAAGAMRAAQALGARIYSPHDVKDVVAGKDSVALRTGSGMAVIAKKAVFATGYEMLPQIPKQKYDIISTWAIATKPLPPNAFWPTRCLVWEAADPYLYMRPTADNRILVGGEDADISEAAKRDAATPRKAQRLLSKLNKLLPGRDLKIDYAWAGTFADSPTGLPFLSEVDSMPNCFALLGCGGNGITFSAIAGELITAWADGRRDPDADLFV
jgi:glycine/D-amino acid oxidase-like deaminating enzyme